MDNTKNLKAVIEDLKQENENLLKDKDKLNSKCLSLQWNIDNIQQKYIHFLESIEKKLLDNDYGQPQIKVRKALNELRKCKNELKNNLNN